MVKKKNVKKEQTNNENNIYNIFFSDKAEHQPLPELKLATSLPALNRALTIGGFPAGCLAEFHGPNGYGKSTLSALIMADVGRQNHLGFFIDPERSIDKKYYQSMGVDFKKTPRYTISILEDLMRFVYDKIEEFHALKEDGYSVTENGKQVKKKLDENKILVIVIDTITVTVTADEEDDFKKGYPAKTGLITKFIERLLSKISNDVLIIMVNQERDVLNKFTPYSEDTRSWGGHSIRHNCSVRIRAQRRAKDYDSSKSSLCGYRLDLVVKKCKNVGALDECFSVFVSNGKGKCLIGHDDVKELVSEAIHQGIIKKSGKTNHILPEELVDDQDNEVCVGVYRTYDWFRNRPDKLDMLRDILNDNIKNINPYSRYLEKDNSEIKVKNFKRKKLD